MTLQPYAFPLSNRLSDATLCFAKSCLQSLMFVSAVFFS